MKRNEGCRSCARRSSEGPTLVAGSSPFHPPRTALLQSPLATHVTPA